MDLSFEAFESNNVDLSGAYWRVFEVIDTRKIKLAHRGFLRDSNWNGAVGINYKYFTDRYAGEQLFNMIGRELVLLADDCQPICKSELDGNFYMVNFATKVNDYDDFVPLCWTRIKKSEDYPSFSWAEIRKLQDGGFEIKGVDLVYTLPVPTLPLRVGYCAINLFDGEYSAPNAETVDYLKKKVNEILSE